MLASTIFASFLALIAASSAAAATTRGGAAAAEPASACRALQAEVFALRRANRNLDAQRAEAEAEAELHAQRLASENKDLVADLAASREAELAAVLARAELEESFYGGGASSYDDEYESPRCTDFNLRTNDPDYPNYSAAHMLAFAPDEGFTIAVRERLVAVGEMVANATGGWLTDRHGSYPTTDFSVRDSFPAKYAKEVRTLVERWLLPRLAALGGLRTEDLSIEDLFIVKYEVAADGSTQQHLEPHTDGSTWTFSMGLNDPRECE